MSALDNYLDTYRDGGIYEKMHYGTPYVSKGVKFARFLKPYLKPNSKVLCIGCGNGFEVIEYLNQGHEAYGTEVHSIDVPILKGRIVNAVVPHLPFADKTFDLLHCTEVLEHIPRDSTPAFLNECKRVSKAHFFSLATEDDYDHTHINLNDISWWYTAFTEAGFNITNFQYKPILPAWVNGNEGFTVQYNAGITLYADGHC